MGYTLCYFIFSIDCPDSDVHGANMGHIWGRQDPGGPHEPFYLGEACHTVDQDLPYFSPVAPFTNMD